MKSSDISIWHGFGEMSASVMHDGDNGNAAWTSITLNFGESQLPNVNIVDDGRGSVHEFSLSMYGSCERYGLAQILRAVADELEKPYEQLGEKIRLSSDDDEEDESSILAKGIRGETELNKWLQSVGISYVYVNQSQQTFSKLFQGDVKRPDFLVLFESVGLIAVDAKNYKPFNDTYSLSFEKELRRVLAFERLFRIPVWYAYLSEADDGSQTWYWISALKALEVGEVKTSKTGEEFLSLHHSHFEKIISGADLGKLYTHRLPSVKRIAAEG